jgi:hypothetical protein
VAVVFLASLSFSALGAKHLTILLPALCGLLALGLLSFSRARWLGWLCGLLILATTIASQFNYFTNRQFADADMVTPWREIAATVERLERPGDALIVGYHPDRGVYDIFRRYYRGKLDPQYLDFSGWRAQLLQGTSGRNCWLLLHDSDPWEEIEAWMKDQHCSFILMTFQRREHTLTRLQAGYFLHAPPGKFESPLYRLYSANRGLDPRRTAH